VGEIQTGLWEARVALEGGSQAAFQSPAVRARLAALDQEHRDRTRKLRGESGVYWGTYLTVEQGLRGVRSGAPPRFVGRQWPGKIAVQLQRGATWDEVLEWNGQYRVEILPLPPSAAPGGRRSERPRAMLHIRVGSEGPPQPRAGHGPSTSRAPPPHPERRADQVVYLLRRRVGIHDDWSVQFVVSRESWDRADTADPRGAAALDLGWRALEDGSLRVAYRWTTTGRRTNAGFPPTRWPGGGRSTSCAPSATTCSKWLGRGSTTGSPPLKRLSGLPTTPPRGRSWCSGGGTTVFPATRRSTSSWRRGGNRASTSWTGRHTSAGAPSAGRTITTVASRPRCDGVTRRYSSRTRAGAGCWRLVPRGGHRLLEHALPRPHRLAGCASCSQSAASGWSEFRPATAPASARSAGKVRDGSSDRSE
jgi:hypothetical protein